MKRVKVITATVLAIIISAIFVYAQEAKQENSPPAGQQGSHEHSSQAEKRYVASVRPDGVQEVAVIGGEYYFDPNYIIVKVNIPVELTVLKAKGFVPHDILVKAPDAGIDFKIKMSDKEPKKVTFTPTKVGKYEMYCDEKLLFFKSHKDKGMKGTIEVVP